ncbi:acetoin utilization AcuB family protein [Sporosarcina thermotolerans]|uniref:Acetoin utilization AcuB family protein n=1 Tax=Sporosarcina thermotolerans TaxID=633404 RepID=A0AAW9AC21_9BACL|nr:acetoin utilization AcuB family protein [Sporosarcina thermotolerans]MDW0117156.1 acetoin utilization AcuB family protein [Sporosarcina thermotolerans]WHT47767.1 acetoin utilization AcuB family protein [Sporosarcina thermotolerans]
MLIEEIMKRNVFSLSPHHTVKDALSIMQEKKIRHLPIVSETTELLGIITDRDMKEVLPSLYSDTTDVTVYKKTLSEIMTKNPITGHPMDFVEEAAVVFYDNQIGCLPIVSNNKLVGILTETDLLYKYIELTGAHQPGSQIEVRVPNIPGILFEVSKVFYEHKINVQSILVYPDKENEDNKILVIRLKTMNPLNVIKGLKNNGFEVLWPNVPGMDL